MDHAERLTCSCVSSCNVNSTMMNRIPLLVATWRVATANAMKLQRALAVVVVAPAVVSFMSSSTTAEALSASSIPEKKMQLSNVMRDNLSALSQAPLVPLELSTSSGVSEVSSATVTFQEAARQHSKNKAAGSVLFVVRRPG
jgi:hypothetical protein